MKVQVMQTPTHTHTLTPYPVPLSLFVEQNDDQLGVHLVSVLAERQITPLKRHIHQVPEEGNVEENESEENSRGGAPCMLERYIIIS